MFFVQRKALLSLISLSTLFVGIFTTSVMVQRHVFYDQLESMYVPEQNQRSQNENIVSIYGDGAKKVHLRRNEAQQPTSHAAHFPPRMVFWDVKKSSENNHFPQKRLLDPVASFMALAEAHLRNDPGDAWQPHHEHCLPKASWQTQSYPNCNTIHEISVASAAAEVASNAAHIAEEDALAVLGEGWFRTTWRYDRTLPRTTNVTNVESVVLKTLRIARDYLSEYYELHRRDAVAMERLTASPFVVNVYGYCGQSAINELADFPFPGIQNLESFNRRMRGKESPHTNAIKLRMAASIALGVADIHAGGSTDPNDINVYMAHYDLNPRNIALFSGGRPKINDFNIAEFLQYDPSDNATCKFPARLHEPWWRAPEEMNLTHTILVDEKVDIYALGNILYHTLTSHSSRGKQSKDRMDHVRPQVAAGLRPPIPAPYAHSTDPNVLAMIRAIDLCWSTDPRKRATADEVAMGLYEALLNATDMASSSIQAVAESSPESSTADDDAADEVEDKNAMGHTSE
jgi:serine/threonine protein kinase